MNVEPIPLKVVSLSVACTLVGTCVQETSPLPYKFCVHYVVKAVLFAELVLMTIFSTTLFWKVMFMDGIKLVIFI